MGGSYMSQLAINPRQPVEQQFCVDMEIYSKNQNINNAEIFLNINFGYPLKPGHI